MSNLFIVHKICEAMDLVLGKVTELESTKNLIIFVTDRPGNDIRYAIDSSKILVELHWLKLLDFKRGILKTISYYLDKEKIKSLTEMPDYKLNQDHLIKNN